MKKNSSKNIQKSRIPQAEHAVTNPPVHADRATLPSVPPEQRSVADILAAYVEPARSYLQRGAEGMLRFANVLRSAVEDVKDHVASDDPEECVVGWCDETFGVSEFQSRRLRGWVGILVEGYGYEQGSQVPTVDWNDGADDVYIREWAKVGQSRVLAMRASKLEWKFSERNEVVLILNGGETKLASELSTNQINDLRPATEREPRKALREQYHELSIKHTALGEKCERLERELIDAQSARDQLLQENEALQDEIEDLRERLKEI